MTNSKNVLQYRGGELLIENVYCKKMVEKYGTPLLIYSKKRLIDNLQAMKNSFLSRYSNTKFFFAYKACYLPEVLRIIKSQGFGADVTSLYEYLIAARNGLENKQIVWNSPGKSEEEIKVLLNHRCYWNVDSLAEAFLINKYAKENHFHIKIGIRINISEKIDRQYIERGGKLGFDVASGQALEACRIISNMENLTIVGLHCHSSVENVTPDNHISTMRELIDFAKLLSRDFNVRLEYLSPGGGFESREKMEKAGKCIDDFAEGICSLLNELNYNPTLMLEPGRYIVNDAAICIGTLVSKKKNWNNDWWITDMGTNLLLPFGGREFDILPLRREQLTEVCVNVGDRSSSFSGVIKRNAMICNQEIGDQIAAINCGSYTFSCAQNFMYPLNYSFILVDENDFRLIHKSKSEEQRIDELFLEKNCEGE